MKSFDDNLPNIPKGTIDQTLKESIATKELTEKVLIKTMRMEDHHHAVTRLIHIGNGLVLANLFLVIFILWEVL